MDNIFGDICGMLMYVAVAGVAVDELEVFVGFVHVVVGNVNEVGSMTGRDT